MVCNHELRELLRKTRQTYKGAVNADLNWTGEQCFSVRAMAYTPKLTLMELVSTNTPTV